ncbi:MAG: sulfatase-like hydrolase/transferase [Ilumatobacteraceae bacterium]
MRFTNVCASDVPCLPSRTALSTGRFGIVNGVVNHGGTAAEPRLEGPARGFFGRNARRAWATQFYNAGWTTASLSSFPFRHSATWWNHGFMEAMNLMRNMGLEQAHEVLPHALDWLERRGRATTGSSTSTCGIRTRPTSSRPTTATCSARPCARGTTKPSANATGSSPARTVRRSRGGSGPTSGARRRRQPWNLSGPDEVKAIFDGYDVGVRYADDAVGTLMNALADLGVLDDTAVLISSDHGEAFGELGVYADHQAADEATCHIPSVLRWPGLCNAGGHRLHYHLDIAATVLGLAGLRVPSDWDGVSLADGLRPVPPPREITSCCRKGRGRASDPCDGATTCTSRRTTTATTATGTSRCCSTWWPIPTRRSTSPPAGPTSPVRVGRCCGRGSTNSSSATVSPIRSTRCAPKADRCTPAATCPHLDRLRATGRSHWADVLLERHAGEADPTSPWAHHGGRL